jgi:hypothetical protein
MLFPMPESSFADDLSDRLKSEANPQSQKTLMLALWYTVTPVGITSIERFITAPGASAEAVRYGRELLARPAGRPLSSESVAYMRKDRQKVMQQPINDEALIEFDALTLKILSKKQSW